MCTDDPRKHILRLDEAIAQAADEADWAENPETPTAPVTKPLPQDVSEGSAVSFGDSTGTNTAIFFARVPPMVPYDELLELFNRFGTVQDLNLFRRWATAKTSKGCGTVQYSKPEEASSALLALNGVYTFEGFPGCEGPMVVEWMDASRLTSPSDAAAHKGAKATSTSKPFTKSQQHKPRHKNTSSGPGGLPAWQYMQHLNAMHTRALAAAAAAAGCNLMRSANFPGVHPAIEALDVCGLLSTPLTDSCSNNLGAGLADPTSWGSVVPVHLMPMMSQSQVAQGSFGVNAQPAVSPLLPPGALLNMRQNLWNEPSAAAAQLMPQPCGSNSSGLDVLTGANTGVFGCPTPGIEPWLSARSDSTSSSFTPMMPAAFAPGSSSFLAAAAAEQQAQQLRPLMVLESPWGPQGCDTLPSAATNTALGPLNSGSYALFDAALVSQWNEDVTAEASMSRAANIHSSSSALAGLGAGGAGDNQGDTTGFLSGRLSSLLTGDCCMSGFLNTPRAATSAAEAGRPGALLLRSDESYLNMQASTPTPQQCRHDIALTTLQIPLSDDCLGQLALTIPHIAKMSGAELQMTVSPSGMELRLQGAAVEVEAARNLMHLLSPGARPAA